MVRAVPDPRPRKSLLRRGVEIVFTVGFLGFLGWVLARRWGEVSDVATELSVPAVGGAVLAAAAAIWCSFLSWRALLTDLGGPLPRVAGMRIFFVGQLGKYLPGKLWPVLVQARLGREYQVPGRASAAAALLVMLVSLGAALLLTAASFPVLGGETARRYWWVLLALPAAAVVLWPPVFNRLLDRVLRLARREPLPRPLSAAGIGRALGWAVVSWLLFGVHLWVLLLDLGGTGPALLIRSIGAFAGSWAIGFLLALAPAGVGPREVALVVLLGATVTEPAALVAAVVSRLVMTAADLAWPAVALLLARRGRRPVADGPAPEHPAPGDSSPEGPAVGDPATDAGPAGGDQLLGREENGRFRTGASTGSR